jgi:hypothetical protein
MFQCNDEYDQYTNVFSIHACFAGDAAPHHQAVESWWRGRGRRRRPKNNCSLGTKAKNFAENRKGVADGAETRGERNGRGGRGGEIENLWVCGGFKNVGGCLGPVECDGADVVASVSGLMMYNYKLY